MMNQKTITPHITGDLHQINFSLDDFKRIREDEFLYIDKTKLIEDLLAYDKGKVVLFTRPRRFGKSLNLSMLRYFFDRKDDTKELFKGLYIEKSEFFQTHLNQYPVIYLNFKDIAVSKAEDLEGEIIFTIQAELQKLYQKYHFEELKSISFQTKSGSVRSQGIKDITRVLNEKTKKRVIILVDEYDSIINQTERRFGRTRQESLKGCLARCSNPMNIWKWVC